MARVELPGLDKVRPWNGYKGRAIPSWVAHMLRALGVEVHQRPVEEGKRHPWAVADPEDPDARSFYWIVAEPLALLYSSMRNGGDAQEVPTAVLVWAVKTCDLQALDSMLRLAENDQAYAEQVRALYEADLATMGDPLPF